MAVAAPVLSWIAANAGTIATVGTGALAAYSAHSTGVAQQQAAKVQIKREGDAARQREIERKRQLLRALAQQSANAGAAGIAFEGSAAELARADIRDASNDLLIDTANTRSQNQARATAGRNAKRVGNIQAATSLFDTGRSVAGAY